MYPKQKHENTILSYFLFQQCILKESKRICKDRCTSLNIDLLLKIKVEILIGLTLINEIKYQFLTSVFPH